MAKNFKGNKRLLPFYDNYKLTTIKKWEKLYESRSKKNWTYSGHVLLANEALDVLFGKNVPQLFGEGRVLHVAVQTDHAAVVLADLDLKKHDVIIVVVAVVVHVMYLQQNLIHS